MLQTSHRIANLEPDDYLEVHVIGGRGAGKSTYAWQVVAEALQLIYPDRHYSKKQALTKAFKDHLNHGLNEVIDTIDKYSGAVEPEDRLEMLWWDDSGVHGSKYLYYYDLESYMLLQGMWDTIRSGVRCLILTVPEPEQLATFIKGSKATLIEVMRYSGSRPMWRLAKAYEKYRLPVSRTKRGMAIYEDAFKVPDGTENSSIPTSLYKDFRIRRAKFLHDVTSRIKRRKDIMEQKQEAMDARDRALIERYRSEINKLKAENKKLEVEAIA